MPKPGAKPIEFADLEYTLTKLSYADGQEIEIDRRSPVVLGEPSTFYMKPPYGRWIPLLMESRLTDICYSVLHLPTRTLSPLYHHIFKSDPTFSQANAIYLGPMRLHPAEEVWPELTRKGYYGELPQFFT